MPADNGHPHGKGIIQEDQIRTLARQEASPIAIEPHEPGGVESPA
jgi:hypothetical protein